MRKNIKLLKVIIYENEIKKLKLKKENGYYKIKKKENGKLNH